MFSVLVLVRTISDRSVICLLVCVCVCALQVVPFNTTQQHALQEFRHRKGNARAMRASGQGACVPVKTLLAKRQMPITAEEKCPAYAILL